METSQISSSRELKLKYPSAPTSSIQLPRRQSRRKTSWDDETTSSKWRVEAEILRAECNLLRVEKEMAVRRVEKRREKIESTLRSAIDILLSGKEEISEGKNAGRVMDEQINRLMKRVEKITRKSRNKGLENTKSCSNFDEQAHFLERKLKNFDKETSNQICSREIREMAEASFSVRQDHNSESQDDNNHMQTLRKKIERIKKGSDSGSSSKRIVLPYKESQSYEEVCTGHCKAVIRKLVEQVGLETEQCSQMQEMLNQVKNQMEELQISRDFWEKQALDSECRTQTLKSDVQEWKQRALNSEKHVKEMKAEVLALTDKIEKMKKKSNSGKKMQNPSLEILEESKTETILGILSRRLKENRSSQKLPFVEGGSRRRRTNSVCFHELMAQERFPLQEI